MSNKEKLDRIRDNVAVFLHEGERKEGFDTGEALDLLYDILEITNNPINEG